jgi:hypothetical protein
MPSTNQSIVVNQSVQTVWDAIKDFHDMSWSANVITKCDPVGDKPGNEPGAQRVLNDAFHETLIEVSGDNHLIRHSIDNGPPPVSPDDVSNDVGEIRLTSEGDNTTLVVWPSSWDSTSEDAAAFCQGIYVALLGDHAGSLN